MEIENRIRHLEYELERLWRLFLKHEEDSDKHIDYDSLSQFIGDWHEEQERDKEDAEQQGKEAL